MAVTGADWIAIITALAQSGLLKIIADLITQIIAAFNQLPPTAQTKLIEWIPAKKA